MLAKTYRPLLWLSIFILIVSLACGFPQASETESVQTKEVEVQPDPSETPEQQPDVPEPESQQTTRVNSLQDVKNATIQIEAQGSFSDPEIGMVYNLAGRGSGFIIDPSGIAVTNNHVVTGAALLKVWVGGDTGREYNAKVLGVSECSDLAVIDIEGDGFPYLEWFGEGVNVGLEVYAAGFPLGDPEFTLTKGIISKEKTSGETSWASVDSVIEHDATINPGNSGGPLVTRDGKVVGINYAGASQTKQYFAIGQDVAVPLVSNLKEGRDVNAIGVNGQIVMSDDGSISGVWVSSVESGSSADKAGLQGGDIVILMEGLVLGVDGTMSQYCDILRTHNSGDTLSLEVLRWMSGEYLIGQLNGRTLGLASSVDLEPNPGNVGDVGNSVDGYYEYYLVADDTNGIQMEIPAAWDEIDGASWTADWGGYAFESPSIIASANIDSYLNTYDESGVFFAASKRLGEIGGYIQLLDGLKGWHEDSCSLSGTYDYGFGEFEDPLYEGKFDLWEDCGPNNNLVMMLAARPKANPTAYLLILEIKITGDADLDALDRILQSFQANF